MLTVLGSLNMDLVAVANRYPSLGETVSGREFHTIVGGKGLNQAVAAARAGGQVAMLGAVGSDSFGDALRQRLAGDGVAAGLLRQVDGASGTALIVVDSSGQNAIVVIPGANGQMLGLTEPERHQIAASKFLLLQLEVPLPTVIAAAKAARAAGVQVVLTPAPVPDGPLPDELLEHVDWLVPNEHEAAMLAGAADLHEAGRRLLSRVGHVVITLGEAGCLYLSREGEALAVPAPYVTAVDTTAAGDNFTGALAVALSESKPVADALAWACRAAAISVTRLGASSSAPLRAEIDG